jgi:cytochrome c553
MSDVDLQLQTAINLREIQRLANMLHDQAYHHANDHDIPGGEALIQNAPVANQEAWANRYDTAERLYLAGKGPQPFTEDDDETALQLLEFWWERWTFELNGDCDTDPTLQTAAEWLAKPDIAAWAAGWEQRFDMFAKDVAEARRILENTLLEGERSVFGVQCVQCHERSLVRVTEPRLPRKCGGHRDANGNLRRGLGCCDRGGLQERWVCPNCDHSMQLADYESAVMRDYISHAPYLRAEHIERRTFVKPGTVRVWASRGHVRTRKDPEGRTTYCVEDVELRVNLGVVEETSESA